MRIVLSFICLMIILQKPLFSQGSKKDLKPENDIRNKDYYQKLSSDVERLHKLRCGTFVQYNQDSTGKLIPWFVNMGEDSVMLVTVPVGSANKDGYWVYHHQFMSNMPDMPLYTALEQIIPHSRDSFEGVFYKCPISVSLEDLQSKKNLFEKVNLKNLEKIEEQITYRRISYTEFYAYSGPYIQNPGDKAKDRYTVDYYKITPEHIRFYSTGAKGKISMDLIRNHNPPEKGFSTYLVRFYPEEISLFAEMKKKGK